MRHSISQKALVTGSYQDFFTPIFLSDCAAIFRSLLFSLSLCFKNEGFQNRPLLEQKQEENRGFSIPKPCPKIKGSTIAFKTVLRTTDGVNSMRGINTPIISRLN
jgi:hypothetical protein